MAMGYLAWVLDAVRLGAFAIFVVAVVSIGFAARRRWLRSLQLGRIATVTSGLLLISAPILTAVVYRHFVDSFLDASSKATLLAQSIAEVMNCNVATPLALIAGGAGWRLGVWGSRREADRLQRQSTLGAK